MSKIFNISKKLIIVCSLTAVILFVWFAISNHNNSIEVYDGKIKDIKTMVQLCSVEFYNEVVIVDTLDNNKVLCAKQKQRGSVSFDLENIEFYNDGDTAIFILPPEIVEVFEDTDDNSWEIIDEHNLELFGSDDLNEDEEKQITNRHRENSIHLLYQNGVVRRAREEGVDQLQMFMEKICRKPVIVVDLTPEGTNYNEYQ